MAKKRDKQTETPTVFLPQLLAVDVLTEHPHNSQKQSKHEFAELRKSIKTNGFDESLLVRPNGDGTFEIIAGNHRYRAGKAEGMTEFPCVVRDDWDDVKSEIESVRRNYVRGAIDKAAFTMQVNRLSNVSNLPLDVIISEMGFEDADVFSKYYERERVASAAAQEAAAKSATSAQAVKILDDLGTVLAGLLSRYGHSVPNSFLIFPTGGKTHMYVSANPSLKQVLQQVAEQAIQQGLDINIAIAGLLQIGAAHSGFFKGDGGVEVNEEGSKELDGDDEFEVLTND